MWWSRKKKKEKEGMDVKAKRNLSFCKACKSQDPSQEAKEKSNWFFFFFQFSTRYLILSCVLNSGPCTCLKPFSSHHSLLPLCPLTKSPPSFITEPSLTPSPSLITHTLTLFSTHWNIHQTPSQNGQSGKANKAQVSHQEIALIDQAQPQQQQCLFQQKGLWRNILFIQGTRTRTTTSCGLCRQV